MRILVLWRQATVDMRMRNTDIDHAFCLQRYDTENEYFYFNIYKGRFAEDYSWINGEMFDVVLFHYSAMELRTSDKYWDNFRRLMTTVWRTYLCKKIIMVQDDYTITKRIWDLALGIKADKIYTVMRECDCLTLYPPNILGNIEIKTVLTGYIEESYINKIHLQSHRCRKYDVVYRAQKLPYKYGKHGQLKYELALYFRERLKDSGLICDLAGTDGNKGAVPGDSWFDFLASSRTTIGCLGGAGFADITGDYETKVREYTALHTDATYEETKDACFSNIEENLTGVISPRIFDATITKTCQILVGEDYQGILMPNIDYIVLDTDFSNIDEVVMKMKDIDYCEEIAENCYEHVVKSQKYTYAKFAKWIINDIGNVEHVKSPCSDLSRYIEKMCKKNNDTVMNTILLGEERTK